MIAEKGLACEERDVSLPQSEHKEPWFMRLNLGEEVPVIIHRDNIISDYDQIIDYVERTFTGGTAATPTGAQPQTPGTPKNLGEPEEAHWDCGQGPVSPKRKSGMADRAQMPTAPRDHRATGMATILGMLQTLSPGLQGKGWPRHGPRSKGATTSVPRSSGVRSMATGPPSPRAGAGPRPS